MSTLTGKRVLVTGGGAGIGAAIALAMADAGADVAVADLDPKAAERVAGEVKAKGAKGLAIQADCGDTRSIEAMVGRTVEALGGLDVIVNNAGITRALDIMEIGEKDWDDIYRVNAKGVFICLHRAAKQMIDQGKGGCIINIASISGRGFLGASNAAYAASKGAVVTMTWTAAQQLGRHNINVNAICPGVTTTDLVSRVMTERGKAQNRSFDDVLATEQKRTATGRLNTPEDIASMAVFLASDVARNVTGQCLNVDGGTVFN